MTGNRKGEQSPNWQGDEILKNSGQRRAQKLYLLDQCERCEKAATERHHIDGKTTNNAPDNIQLVCRACHMAIDGRLVRLHSRPTKPPQPCINCQRPTKHRRLCGACTMYAYRNGKPRPTG